jgi:hypothetical protein
MDVCGHLERGDARTSAGFVINPDGLVCSLSMRYDYPVMKPLVPPSLRSKLLATAHDRSAHLAGATRSLVSIMYHWKGIGEDVNRFSATCESCQRTKHPTGNRRIPNGPAKAAFVITNQWVFNGLL